MALTLLHRYSAWIVNAFFKGAFQVRIHGLENIPPVGGAIVAINHASYFDPPLVGGQILRVRPFKAIGKKEIFNVPILSGYLRSLGSIPVNRGQADHGAMRMTLEFLKSGEILLMAPEGTRGTSGKPRTPKRGISFLAHHSGVPIIPTRIEGTAWPPKRGGMWVRFGKPLYFDASEIETLGVREAYQNFSQRLMDHIYAMREQA